MVATVFLLCTWSSQFYCVLSIPMVCSLEERDRFSTIIYAEISICKKISPEEIIVGEIISWERQTYRLL